jgi:NAD+ diphosphatase
MLTTPAGFTSLLASQQHEAPTSFVFCGDELLVMQSDLSLPAPLVLGGLGLAPERFFPVGAISEQYCQTSWIGKGELAASQLEASGLVFKKLRALFGTMDEAMLSIAGRAFQIAEWARTHRFCGHCGGAMQLVDGERCAKCPGCGFMAYPRISPAMMVLIRRDDSILLARHHNSPARFFTALAGFVEAGESVEDAIHREVHEEVGLKVRDLRYFGSQPWPFPHSLMIAYTAEFDSGDIRVDANEIAEARWFGPDDQLPAIPLGISIAGDLIQAHLPTRSLACASA